MWVIQTATGSSSELDWIIDDVMGCKNDFRMKSVKKRNENEMNMLYMPKKKTIHLNLVSKIF